MPSKRLSVNESVNEREASMSIKVNPGETYQAHVGGPDVAATVTVHAPSGRVVDEWAEEDRAILGASVEDLRADGYTVTPWAEA
jgi:hypothetical protein